MKSDVDSFRRLEDLFHEVMRLPQAGWSTAVDRLCGDDATLRAELESLLAHADPCSSPLHLAGSLRPCPPDDGADPNIGRKIGPYELQAPLGRGGMANVYLAVQSEPVQRTVAIKIIKRGLDTDETIRRFQNERQVLAGLKHPSITQLFDAGSTDDHLPYFVMEYVIGEPLTLFCERNELMVSQRLRLFQKVCEAVHFAHQNAVIHRDLKPAHILVTAAGLPKLLDFGISKFLHPHATGDVTRSEDRYMTLEYASPEQIEGGPITTATDIYSLGAVLYELLTGARPSDFRPREGTDATDRARFEPPRPSDAVLRIARRPSASGLRVDDKSKQTQTRRELRGDIDNIVMTALRREQPLRYASVEQFSADIERYLRHEPVLAAPPSRLYQIRKFARRNRALVVLLAAILLGATGSGLGGLWALRARNDARIAEQNALVHAEQLRRALAGSDMGLAWVNFRANLIGATKSRLAAVPEDLRAWDWHYLNAQADDSLDTWRGHDGAVRAVAFEPEGTTVASGGMDRIVRLWDCQTGTLLRRLEGHRDRITSLAYSADSARLISAGMDGLARIWDPRTGTVISDLCASGPGIISVQFSPDSRWIAVGSADQTVRLYDAATALATRTFRGFGGKFATLAFTADSRRLLIAGGFSWRFWEVQTGNPCPEAGSEEGEICSVALSADGELMGLMLRDHQARLRQMNALGTVFRRLSGRVPLAGSIAFSPDSQRLACAGVGNTGVRVWKHAGPIAAYRGHEKLTLAVAFSPDGRRLVTGSDDGTLKLWDADPPAESESVGSHRGEAKRAAFNNNGGILASVGGADGQLTLWEVEARRQIRSIHAHAGGAYDVAYSPDGEILATCGRDGFLKAYDAATASILWRSRVEKQSVHSLDFSPDGRRIVTGSQTGTVATWNVRNGIRVLSFPGLPARANAVRFSADGSRVIAACDDGTIRIWDATTARPIRTLTGHRGPVRCLAVTYGEPGLASGGEDGTIRMWDLAEGTQVRATEAHQAPVLSVGFSYDGQRLVSTSADLATKIWDTQTWSDTLTLRHRTIASNCAVFSRDGQYLATTDEDGDVGLLNNQGFAARLQARESYSATTEAARAAVDSLLLQTGDLSEVARAIAADHSLGLRVRQQALVRVMDLAGNGPPLRADWLVRFFARPAVTDAGVPVDEWSHGMTPTLELAVRSLTFSRRESERPAPNVPHDHFALVASTTLETRPGSYRLTVRSDDGIRVWIDGRKIIDNWTTHQVTSDSAEIVLTEGPHAIRVEYFESTGQAELWASLAPLHHAAEPEKEAGE